MSTIASQITSLTVVYSSVYSDVDQRKTSKLRVTGLCVANSPGPVNSPHKWPVTRKMFPFDDVIMPWLIHAVVAITLMYSNGRCGQEKRSGNLNIESPFIFEIAKASSEEYGNVWIHTLSSEITFNGRKYTREFLQNSCHDVCDVLYRSFSYLHEKKWKPHRV